MKLIDESNWKQEIARLKAERILLGQEFNKMFDKVIKDGGSKYHLTEINSLSYAKEKVDKAIETIENVFVHKQCYIDN